MKFHSNSTRGFRISDFGCVRTMVANISRLGRLAIHCQRYWPSRRLRPHAGGLGESPENWLCFVVLREAPRSLAWWSRTEKWVRSFIFCADWADERIESGIGALAVGATRFTVYSCRFNRVPGIGFALYFSEMCVAFWLEAQSPTPRNGFVFR
jgi:hypothetical protein